MLKPLKALGLSSRTRTSSLPAGAGVLSQSRLSSADRWDQRYQAVPASTAPSELLVRFRGSLPSGGLAADLACGGGRNSVYLAQCGLRVLAIDRSPDALKKGKELAKLAGVRVHWVRADLDYFSFPPNQLQVLNCFYYRDPRLYPLIRSALRTDGLLLYETYTLEHRKFATGPTNPDYLLRPGELLRAFDGWRILYYREAWSERGLASLVARKP